VTFFATTTVDVEVPAVDGEDSYGDEVRTYVPTHYGVRATITERRRRVWDPNESRTATVTWHEGLLPAGIPLPTGTRLRDGRTGRILHVTHARTMDSVAFPNATQRVELEDPTQ
jgi:hypothetical protein